MQKPAFELHILGPTELRGPVPGAGESLVRQTKRLAVLAYLAVSTADGFRRRDQVTALFWPELDQPQARTNLRKTLYGIREELGQDLFLTRGEDELRVDQELVSCDAVLLAQHIRDARWSEALSLYRGELLEGLFPEGVAQEFQEWLASQRRSLREQAAQAAWECSRLEEERGDRTAAAVMARRARELDPDNEEGVRRLMGLLDRRGDRAGALRAYSEWQARLLEEFGVEPAPETRKLARKVQAARKGESKETPPVSVLVVQAEPGQEQPAAAVAPPSRSRIRWSTGMLPALLVMAVLAVSATVLMRNGSMSRASIAVLPLRPIGDRQLEGSAETITEELLTVLTQDTSLVVRAVRRGDAAWQAATIEQIGRTLRTDFIADGAVHGGGGRMRVTLRLVRTADAVSVWAGSYELPDSVASTSAREIATAAAGAIRGKLSSRRAP
jgi:DNA-binding SARP family transcriptional activator/TolB-like protein